MNTIEVSFPGGKKVNAITDGFEIKTDQPIISGGENIAPSPFKLFLSSIATCAGFYALEFCNTRNIETKDMKLIMNSTFDKEKKLYTIIDIKLNLPNNFPEKFNNAIIKSMNLCTVKKHLANPPLINIDIV